MHLVEIELEPWADKQVMPSSQVFQASSAVRQIDHPDLALLLAFLNLVKVTSLSVLLPPSHLFFNATADLVYLLDSVYPVDMLALAGSLGH